MKSLRDIRLLAALNAETIKRAGDQVGKRDSAVGIRDRTMRAAVVLTIDRPHEYCVVRQPRRVALVTPECRRAGRGDELKVRRKSAIGLPLSPTKRPLALPAGSS